MDALVNTHNEEKKPRNGLYTIQFSFVPSEDTLTNLKINNANVTAAAAAATNAAANSTLQQEQRKRANRRTEKNNNNNGSSGSVSSNDNRAGAADADKEKEKECKPQMEAEASGLTRSPRDESHDDPTKEKREEGATAISKKGGESHHDPYESFIDRNSPEFLAEAAAAAARARDSDTAMLKDKCASEYGPWTLLCRLRFEGDVMGHINGSVKVRRPATSHFSRNSSSSTSSRSDMSSKTNSASQMNFEAARKASSASGLPVKGIDADSPPPPPPPPPPTPPAAASTASDGKEASSSDNENDEDSAVAQQSNSSGSSRKSGSGDDGGSSVPEEAAAGAPPSQSQRPVLADSSSSNNLPRTSSNYSSTSPTMTTTGTSRVCIQPESLWRPNDEVRLVLAVDRLDGSVVGSRTDLTNVTIRCQTHVSSGWYVGNATMTLSNGTPLQLPRKIRFLMKQYTGLRCTWCLDPIDVPIRCPGCHCIEFCSQQCADAHAAGHAALCPILKQFGGPDGCCKAPATFAGVDFFVYWRCIKGTAFEIIVDHNNPLGRPYEIVVNTLKDAREGLEYAFLAPPPAGGGSSSTGEGQETPFEELNEVNISVFFALARHSRDEGCLLLTAAALNHLSVWCADVDALVQSYFQFYDTCVRDQFEGNRSVSSLGEYVMFVRTTYELGQCLMEWALKAPFASSFWQRLAAAKDVLVSLYNFNASLTFDPFIQNVKGILVSDQQRQTLHLLAKVYVVMASRAPKDLAQRLLRRAEECYRDAIDEDKNQKNVEEMGGTMLKLAALCTMFETDDDRARALELKQEGIELLQAAARMRQATRQVTTRLQQQQQQQQRQGAAATGQ